MLFASIIAARSLIIFSLEIYENGSLLMSDLKKCMVKKKTNCTQMDECDIRMTFVTKFLSLDSVPSIRPCQKPRTLLTCRTITTSYDLAF